MEFHWLCYSVWKQGGGWRFVKEATPFHSWRLLGPVQTWCPCSVPGHWKGHCSDSVVLKEQSLIYFPPLCLLYRREAWGKGVRTDKILFRPVPVPRNGARVLPLELVPVPGTMPKFLLRHRQNTMFRLGAVPENRAWAPSLNGALVSHISVRMLKIKIISWSFLIDLRRPQSRRWFFQDAGHLTNSVEIHLTKAQKTNFESIGVLVAQGLLFYLGNCSFENCISDKNHLVCVCHQQICFLRQLLINCHDLVTGSPLKVWVECDRYSRIRDCMWISKGLC